MTISKLRSVLKLRGTVYFKWQCELKKKQITGLSINDSLNNSDHDFLNVLCASKIKTKNKLGALLVISYFTKLKTVIKSHLRE